MVTSNTNESVKTNNGLRINGAIDTTIEWTPPGENLFLGGVPAQGAESGVCRRSLFLFEEARFLPHPRPDGMKMREKK